MSGEAEVGLEQLKLLKKAFEDADDDGSGELDIDEFVEQLGPYLGKDLTHEQICQLFMKIDADAGGTVDWDEFSNYMFLKKADADGDNSEAWRFFPADDRSRAGDTLSSHNDAIERIRFLPVMDKYVTCGKDGTFRVWNAADGKHVRTVVNGARWVNDVCHVKASRKLVAAAMDRSLTWYDINRGSYEVTGRLFASGLMGTPTCVNTINLNGASHVMYGDSVGKVNMLLVDTSEPFQPRDLLYTDHTRDYVCLHDNHKDWISKVEHIEDVGLVTASLDSRIFLFDISRDGVMHEVDYHTKGVRDFAYCRPYSLFASCGERNIVLWGSQTGRLISELLGHTAAVHSVKVDDDQCQLVSMSVDHIIKVWDLRTNRCVQTITEEDWARPEDAAAVVMEYDGIHKRLITGVKKPCLWDHKLVVQDRTGHRAPLVKAIYNSAFFVVVSADESGCIINWNLLDGQREGRFFHAHGGSKLTSVAFDSNQRRMVSAGNDGAVKMWNFNNGSMLREYTHSHKKHEISKVIYITDERRQSECIYAAGWNQKVFIWEDEDEDVVEECRELEGHQDDILCMDEYLPRTVLATGDYEGRIIVWNSSSGERRLNLYHRSDRYENSVEALKWIPTSDDDYETVDPMILVSAGGDGILRVWKVTVTGSLMCTLPGARGDLEVVRDLACDESFQHLISCDSSGHLRVMDVSALSIDTVATPSSTRHAFQERSYFRVCESSINGVSIIGLEERSFVLAACADYNVYLFTLDGGLVGIFGVHKWQISDESTYVDLDRSNRLPVLDEVETQYELAKVHKEERASTAMALEEEPMPWDGSSLATYYFKERREKIQKNLTAKPKEAVHGFLRIKPAQELPTTIYAIMDRAPKQKRAGRRTALSGTAAAVSK